MEGRSFNSYKSKYKFTQKERNIESNYDYFGARYYDSRIGKWGQVEPLLEEFFAFSPYSYSLNLPTRLIDPNGKDVIVSGENNKDVYNYLRFEFKNLKLKMDKKTGKLSYSGTGNTEEEILLMNAIDNPDIVVNLISTLENNIAENYFAVGLYVGSNTDEKGITQVTQYFNLEHAKVWREAGGGTIGRSVMHEILEGYIGGYFYPGSGFSSYEQSHEKTISIEKPQRFYPQKATGVIYDPARGVNIFNRKFLIDANGKEHLLYTKEDIKY